MPLVFIIDLDGTLIGNIEPQVCYSSILVYLNKYNYDDNKLPDNIKTEIFNALSNGLARPHFKEFYETTKQKHPDREFFIYTSSSKDWANYIVECFEELHNIKFNRPIFTREHCDSNNNKSIRMINSHIIEVLQNPKDINYIIIDDNECIYNINDRNKLIVCPTYKKVVNVDILEKFPRGMVAKYYKEICNILETEMSLKFPEHTKKMHKSFMRQYKNNIMNYVYKNIHNAGDIFWRKLCNEEWV
jgi:hypothetical protein